jgi:general secretion pathway protein D
VPQARRLLGATLGLTLALAAVVRAQPPPRATPEGSQEAGSQPPGPAVVEADGERYITMDFQDVDIAVLVKFIGEITGKNFVMDERVKGQVTVVSPTRVTPEEAYQLFQAVLQVKGFTTVPSGAAIRIIPTKDAKGTSLRTLTDGAAHVPSEEYITRVVPLNEVDAADVINVLQPLVSPDGLITASPHTNALIIIDSAANIARLIRLIDALDVPSSRRQTVLIPVKYTLASDLADTIQMVLEEQTTGAAPPPGKPPAMGDGRLHAFRITPDDRTNTLIVQAAGEQMRQIKELAESLDVRLPPGTGRIHVYYLKYASAEDMLPVLLDVIGAQGGAAQAASRTQARQQQSRRGSSLQRAYRPPAPPGARQPVRGGQTGPGAVQFADDIRITADPATNALIVTATAEDYELLRGVIERLDIRRRQVNVEAILLEITMDRMRQLGIELQGAIDTPNGVGIARTNLTNLNDVLTNPGSISGMLAAALSKRTVMLQDGTKVPAEVALLTALEDDQDINVLSAPNILTTDNEEAEIIVGQNVPFVASRSTDSSNLANTFATIQREDVGITLRMTPQISEGSMVRLTLFEEVSRLVDNPLLVASDVGPTTTVRSASTTVTVRDGQTVVIGGLISDASTASERRVPFLGDIPVLGNLFKSTSSNGEKINLLIFLTPHIIKDEVDAAALSAADRDRFRGIMSRTRTPKRRPDPLDAPSFELPEEEPAAGAAAEAASRDQPPPEPAPAAARAAETAVLTLGDIHVARTGGTTTIDLGVGPIPVRVAHFALAHPARYVIDVYGRSLPQAAVDFVPVSDRLVRRVRVARHSGRMRLVLDLTAAEPPPYELATHGATITLRLGSSQPAETP